jgi:PTS system fructose-specific IIC component/PTS system nitrogen regulatory IIA component
MFLKEIFPVECIRIGLESEDKDELFEELVDAFVTGRGMVADRAAILSAIREREALMSTGIKKGIAIPHGKSSCVKGVAGVLGISRKGIDYDALDGEPVYLVFLLLSSPDGSEQHLRILKKLAVLLENPSFQSDIAASRNPQEALRVLEKYEEIHAVGD